VDAEAFEKIQAHPPTPESHPSLFAWFCLVMKFAPAVRATWKAEAAPAAKGGKGAGKKEEKKAAKADDDDMDLFGDDGDDAVSI